MTRSKAEVERCQVKKEEARYAKMVKRDSLAHRKHYNKLCREREAKLRAATYRRMNDKIGLGALNDKRRAMSNEELIIYYHNLIR